MRRLSVSDEAADDVLNIRLYIAEDNPRAAKRFYESMRKLWQTLRTFPEMGRARPDIAPDARVFPFGSYLLIYQVTEKTVRILRVLHGARDISAEFQRGRDEGDE